VKRIGCFRVVFITICTKNMAQIGVQHSVPSPDISRTLRKQFLVGYHGGDTFKGFHYLFSPVDILRSLSHRVIFYSVLNSDLASDLQVTDVESYTDTPTKLDISGL